jgi:hypothetical protein
MNPEHKKAFVASIIGIPAALIVALLAWNLTEGLREPQASNAVTTSAPPTSEVAGEPELSEPVTPSGDPTPESASPSVSGTPSPVVVPVYLDQLETIEDAFYDGPVSWGAQTFPHSLQDYLSGCSSVGPVDWVIPARMSTFSTEVGVAVDSVEADSRVTFSIYLDGVNVSTATLGVGEHNPVTVPLDGAQRLRLEAIIDESRRGNCNTEAKAAWGNPVFAP